MATAEAKPRIPVELLAAMEEVARAAMSPVRDSEKMRQACVEMDSIRGEILQKHGVLNIGVPAVRELRDSE